MEATAEQSDSRHAAHVTAEAVDAVAESTIHRTADAFAESVDSFASSIVDRRAIEETPDFADGRAEALHVSQTGFRNGRTAALRARPGEDPGADSIEAAALECEINARQYTGHVPHVIYGRADRDSLWQCYERSVTAGIRSVRRTPFGDGGPTVYDTADRGFDLESILSERLQIEPRSGGGRAYDTVLPMGFVEKFRPMAGDVRVASQFVWSYADGAIGAPLPYTDKGVSLLRAYNAEQGTRFDAPDRVVRFVEA